MTKRTRIRLIAVLAAVPVVALLAGIATFQPSLPGGRVIVFFTQEVRGHVVPCGCYEGQPGGIARMAAAAGDDFHSPSALLVDGGDLIGRPRIRGFDDPDRPSHLLEEKRTYLLNRHNAQVQMFSRLGYAASVPGELDFVLGQSFPLVQARNPLEGAPLWKHGTNLFLCANLVTPSGAPLFETTRMVTVGQGSVFRVIRFGGVKVGLLGLMAENVKIPRSADDMYNLTVLPPGPIAREHILALRAQGAQVVVVLFHGRVASGLALMQAVEGIDLLVAGHEGHLHQPRKAGGGWLVQIDPGAAALGKAVLTLEGGRVTGVALERLRLSPDLPEDPDVLAPYSAFQRAMAADPPKPPLLAVPSEPFAGSAACRECHPGPWRQWAETPHARAFASLEKSGHTGDPECVQCHVTGFGIRTGYGADTLSDDLRHVGCEVCHGPHGDHARDWEARKAAGETLPRAELKPSSSLALCLKCHDTAHDPGFKNNGEKRFNRIRHQSD